VRAPSRRAATAAPTPAGPPPTTRTSVSATIGTRRLGSSIEPFPARPPSPRSLNASLYCRGASFCQLEGGGAVATSVRPAGQAQVHEELRRALGQQVRQLRLDRGLTLEEVASRSGCSLGSLSQLERGLGNPSFATLVRISHALRVSVGQLVELGRDG